MPAISTRASCGRVVTTLPSRWLRLMAEATWSSRHIPCTRPEFGLASNYQCDSVKVIEAGEIEAAVGFSGSDGRRFRFSRALATIARTVGVRSRWLSRQGRFAFSFGE